jgi:16S rRNA (adenine1518-N6/adenine1519-N6)-dimethyltransferase
LPRKLGQHFLVDQHHLKRIAEAACGTHTNRIVEIGPGKGALTRYLLERAKEVHAIEIDPALVPVLETEFGGNPAFHLHHADVLETDLSQWGEAVVAGNLPYYITSPIVARFLKLDLSFPRAVFLVQDEVAERLRAKPNSRDYGYLSVQVQLLCDVRIVSRVPPGAFSPRPKVNSAVVALEKLQAMDDRMARVIRFAGWCFSQKRKNLRNNLKPYYPAAVLDRLPEGPLRAEQLPVARFAELLEHLDEAATET